MKFWVSLDVISTRVAGLTYLSRDKKLKIGATAIHDENESVKTDLLGVDVRYRPDLKTEFRAELAVTDNEAKTANALNGDTGCWRRGNRMAG